jgi:hypothetical protein
MDSMLHVFRNSPLGRENLLQSIYFCERLSNLPLSVYIPDHTQYLMYFDGTVVTVDLDSSYTRYRESAKEHVCGLLRTASVDFEIFTLTSFTAKALPEIPNRWQIMSCPRAISDDISRIGLGHIGPRVRAIFKEATFPVFIPSPSAKTWQRVAAFYGGSDLGLRAVRQAINLADRADVPLTLHSTEREQAGRVRGENPHGEAGRSAHPIEPRLDLLRIRLLGGEPLRCLQRQSGRHGRGRGFFDARVGFWQQTGADPKDITEPDSRRRTALQESLV